MRNLTVVNVEGNIGAGKSTVLELVRQEGVVSQVVAEPVSEWTEHLLGSYSSEDGSWALPLQSLVECTRTECLLRAARVEDAHSERVLLVERSQSSSKVFAELTVSEEEMFAFDVLQARHRNILKQRFDAVREVTVYLRCDPTECLRRTRKRAREGEEGVSHEFLQKVHDAHERCFGNSDLVIDCSGSDQRDVAKQMCDFLRSAKGISHSS